MLSTSNICQLMPLCPSGGLCRLARTFLRRLGWACSSSSTTILICRIFQCLLKQRKKKKEKELSPPAGVQSSLARKRRPHPADLTGIRPRFTHSLPFPGSTDPQPDLAPKARGTRGEKPAGPWRSRAARAGEAGPAAPPRPPPGRPGRAQLCRLQPLS